MKPKPISYYVDNRIWLTRDNTEIQVSSMSDTHILLSYYKCVRDNWRTTFIPIFLDELSHRGFRSTHPELFI